MGSDPRQYSDITPNHNDRQKESVKLDLEGFHRRLTETKENPKPALSTLPFQRSFLNGGALSQNVAGTLGSPIIFSITPPNDQIWYMSNLKMWIEDKGTWELVTFGAIPVLPNGWSLQFIKNGSLVFEIANFKNNFNLLSSLNSTMTLNDGDVSNDQLVLIALQLDNKRPLKLDGAAGDFLRFVVRDDLSELTNLAAGASFWREI